MTNALFGVIFAQNLPLTNPTLTAMNTPNQRKGFTFYRSFAEAIGLLPDAEQLVAYKIIMAYSLDGIEPEMEELPLFVQMLWTAFKPNLDADRRRYENGTKGGCPKGAAKPSMIGNQNAKKQNKTKTKPNQNQNETETKPNQNQNKSNVNANVNVNEKENVNENVEGEVALPPKGVKFTPPSLIIYSNELDISSRTINSLGLAEGGCTTHYSLLASGTRKMTTAEPRAPAMPTM